MKKILFTVIILPYALNTNAQIIFQRIFGDPGDGYYGTSIQQTADGGYISTGEMFDFPVGDANIILVKFNSIGDTLWTKTFGGTAGENGYSVQQTSDGGFIIAGITNSFGVGSYYHIYLIKTDSLGSIAWTKIYRGGAGHQEWGNSVKQTTDGGYIITGYTNSFNSSGLSHDVYLIKTDVNGDSLWTKSYGGTDDDGGYSVQQTTDGGFIITGYTWSFGSGQRDVYLIKTDSTGDLVWTKTYGGSNSEYGESIQQTSDGGYIITGYTNSFGAGNWDVYLIRTDANGDSLWIKTFGGTDEDYGMSVQQTSDGGFIIIGYTKSFGTGDMDVYLIKTDANGGSLWTKTFGGTFEDYSASVHQTSDGGYIITGATGNVFPNYSVFLIKTDSLGYSGCNEASPQTIGSTTATQVTTPATIISAAPFNVVIPITTVSHGGIISTICTGTVNVNEIKTDNAFTISPNPSADNFIISFEGTIIKGKVEILNILGESVFEENIFNESEKEINLKNISSGIYFVKVFDGEKYYCKKIIVEHYSSIK